MSWVDNLLVSHLALLAAAATKYFVETFVGHNKLVSFRVAASVDTSLAVDTEPTTVTRYLSDAASVNCLIFDAHR